MSSNCLTCLHLAQEPWEGGGYYCVKKETPTFLVGAGCCKSYFAAMENREIPGLGKPSNDWRPKC